MIQSVMKMSFLHALVWLLMPVVTLANPLPLGKFQGTVEDEEIIFERKSGSIVFNGEEIKFGSEKILEVNGGGYKDFFSGEDKYFCNATTAFAGLSPGGDIVVVVMDRSAKSSSYGLLCKLSMSPKDFNEPSAFTHYLIRAKDDKATVTKTSVFAGTDYSTFNRLDLFTNKLLTKNKNLGKYIQQELGEDDEDTQSLTMMTLEAPRAFRAHGELKKQTNPKPTSAKALKLTAPTAESPAESPSTVPAD